MDNRWVDYKTFGCAMQVYGRVNRYVIDILSKAVMVEQFELDKLGVVQLNYFSRHIVKCDIAVTIFPRVTGDGHCCFA